ncbi:MAG TPA: FAD synthase [Thermoplasmata archaeon]|nr:FAD synthase [Thermoplasmata archaeon]
MVRVMATGVFDLLHVGHLHYLRSARGLGDELVVVVANDDTVRRQKHEPIFGQDLRAELVGALKPVDRVVIGHVGDPFRVVEEIRPDIIALGYDQEQDPQDIVNELERRGLEIQVVRVGKFDGDLNGTRKIIRAVLDRRDRLYTRGEAR